MKNFLKEISKKSFIAGIWLVFYLLTQSLSALAKHHEQTYKTA